MNFSHLALIFSSFLVFSGAVSAGNYGVSPLDLKFDAQTKSGVITIVNEDKRPIELRVRPTSWTQNMQAEDQYQDTTEVVAFPRRLTVQPGEKKIVRVGLGDGGGSVEKAFRVYLEEIAPPATPGDDRVTLAVLVNVGIPVFFNTPLNKNNLSVKASANAQGIVLDTANTGAAHIRLSRLVDEKGQVVSSAFNKRYIFPNTQAQVTIPLPSNVCKGQAVNWKIETSNETPIPVNVTLPTQCSGKPN